MLKGHNLPSGTVKNASANSEVWLIIITTVSRMPARRLQDKRNQLVVGVLVKVGLSHPCGRAPYSNNGGTKHTL